MTNNATQHYSFLQALVMSFYSRPLYRDVYRNWQKSGLFYTLRQTIIIGVLIMLLVLFAVSKLNFDQEIKSFSHWALGDQTHVSTEEAVNRILTIASAIPPLTYRNNILETQNKDSFVVKDPLSGHVLFSYHLEGKSIPDGVIRRPSYFILSSSHVIYADQALSYANLAAQVPLAALVEVLNTAPEMQLVNGQLTTKEPGVFTLTSSTDKQLLAVIDTLNPATENAYPDAPLMLNQDFLRFSSIYLKDPITLRWDKLSPDMLIKTLTNAQKGLRYAMALTTLLMLPVIILALFIVIAPLVCATSFYIHHLLKARGIQTDPKTTLRLGAVAFTPGLVCLILFPPFYLLHILLYLLVTLGYSHFAARAITPR